MHEVELLREELLAAVNGTGDLAALEQLRVLELGKKGRITQLMKGIVGMDPDARRSTGAAINALRNEVAAAVEARRAALNAAALEARVAAERVDVTLPARPEPQGRIHPLSRTIEEVIAILAGMGFALAEGPDIEDDWHNFSALNIPPEHPARQEMDTFYLPGERDGRRLVLRTHTSPVQIRTLLKQPPPVRIMAPGRTYRCDFDATHAPMFHQIEGLIVDEAGVIHFGHLKGCLIEFCRTFFGIDNLPVRFRPSYFPFTEPSAEVDVGCRRQGGTLQLGDFGDWLEILGCGMVNPKVLENCGLDPERWQGFAFGIGLERLTMLKYGLPDLRPFFESDSAWLSHYGFPAFDPIAFDGGKRR